jgi:predicted Zn-dependent protease
MLYKDRVIYVESVTQTAFRDDSLEINKSSASVGGVRVNKDGCWYIVSKQSVELNFNELEEKALHMVDPSRSCGELADAELFKGSIEIGKEFPDEDEVAKQLRDLCLEIKASHGVKCEAIVTMMDVFRAIIRDNGEEAKERKRIVELEVGLLGTAPYGYQLFASNFTAFISWSAQHVIKSLDVVIRETASKIGKGVSIRGLKPYEVGRATLVLDEMASAALIHELSHLLNPLYSASQRLVGLKLFTEGFELYDNPHAPESPAIRFFDDEGVTVRKRTLIEDGVVRDLHHTRTTSKQFSSEPGSAYGLFTKPVPFHTTLVLKSGDWGDKEIIEETKKGFLIEGVSMATLEEGYVRIVPQYSYVIEDGEIKEAIRIREVKIPLVAFRTVSAISKSQKLRVSIEKEWLVAEMSPRIRIEGYVS